MSEQKQKKTPRFDKKIAKNRKDADEKAIAAMLNEVISDDEDLNESELLSIQTTISESPPRYTPAKRTNSNFNNDARKRLKIADSEEVKSVIPGINRVGFHTPQKRLAPIPTGSNKLQKLEDRGLHSSKQDVVGYRYS